MDDLVGHLPTSTPDKVAGIEARGFILGGAVAHRLLRRLRAVRKKGKLPHTTVSLAYSLEYGIDEIEIHIDAIGQGERVLLVDDLSRRAELRSPRVQLLRQVGADVIGAASSSTSRTSKVRPSCANLAWTCARWSASKGIEGHACRRPSLSHDLVRRRGRELSSTRRNCRSSS